ncbi:MAG: family 16 glycoside hydrolase [Akkermansiaceae bacterium]|nr:family 16 glycoside hydrolase [Akkermansiaceae bacterium]
MKSLLPHALALSLLGPAAVRAEEAPIDLLATEGLKAFQATSDWHRAAQATAVEGKMELEIEGGGEGKLLVNGPSKDKSIPYLLTRDVFGDCKVSLEFMIPEKSNAGVYLMGRYEVQILDSFGKEKVGSGDLGGIYARWDKTKPKGEQWWEGAPPKLNAAKAPGEWQSMDIFFRAPRFDDQGIKIQDANFISVHVNGQLVQELATTSGPTASAPLRGEGIAGPLCIQGDHGPIAIRKLVVTPLPCPASTWLAELDAYWATVEKAVSTGDFETYVSTIHPDGVIVADGKQASYPLNQALARWKGDFEKTSSGEVKTHLEFRFRHRYGDPTTAHEAGIFAYTGQQAGKEPSTDYIRFESLLTKKNGKWQMLMERQMGPATEEDWQALAP